MASGYPGLRRPRFKRPDTSVPSVPGHSWGTTIPAPGRWVPKSPTKPSYIGGPVIPDLGKFVGGLRRFLEDQILGPRVPIVFEPSPMSAPGTTTEAQGDAAPNGFSTVAVGVQPVRPVRGFWYFSVDGCPPGSGGAVPFIGQAIYPTEPLPWFASCIHRIQVANNPAWSDTTHVYSRTFSFDLYHGNPYQTLEWTVPGWWFPAPVKPEIPLPQVQEDTESVPQLDPFPEEWPYPTPKVEPEAPPGVEWWFPAELPFLDPWYQPIERPGVFPKPVPYRFLPRRQPSPVRLPHRVVGPGGKNQDELPPVPKDRPFTVFSPDTRTRVDYIPPTDLRAPPKLREKEVKFIANLPQRSVLGRIVNEVTEGIDMIECLFKAMPKDIRKKAWTKELVAKAKANPKQGRKGSTKPSPGTMFRLVYGNTERLSEQQTREFSAFGENFKVTATGWEFAIQECLENQAEDFAFGKAGKAQAKATQKLAKQGLQKRPVGPMTGPAM